MVAGEVDDQPPEAEALELAGCGLAMVSIQLPSTGHWKVEPDANRGQTAPDDTEPGVSLPHVVEKGGSDHLDITSACPGDAARVETVTLVRVILREEDPRLALGQPVFYLEPLGRFERPGLEHIEEPSGEMAQRARHALEARRLALAVDATDGFGPRLEPRRRDLLAAVLTEPVGPGFDLAEGFVDIGQLSFQSLDDAQDLRPFRGDGRSIGEAPAEVDIGSEITCLGSSEVVQLMDEMGSLLMEGLLGTGDIQRGHLLLGWAWT